MDPLRLAELRSWWKVPCIAHFCSLFRGVLFEQSDLDIEDLEEALLQAVSPGDSPVILDLLCSLLEGIYGREKLTVVDYDKYLKDIFRYQHAMGNIKHNPLVDKTYFELSLRQKVDVLHDLCDFRLESEDVMEVLKGHDGDNMRVEPLGHDVNGATYWYFYGTRLYQEDPPPKQPEEEKSPKHKHKKKKKKSEREERAEKRKQKRKDQRQAKKDRDAKKLAAEEKEKLEKEEISENGEISAGISKRPSRRSKRIAVENLTGIMAGEEINDDDEDEQIDDEVADIIDDDQEPKSPEQMEAEVTNENQNGHMSEIDGDEKSSKLENESKHSADVKEKLNIEADTDEKLLEVKEEKPSKIKTELQNGEVKLEENKDGVKTEIGIKAEVKTEIDDKTQIKSEIEDKDEIASKVAIEEIVDISSGVVDALTKIKDDIVKEELAPKAAIEEIADISSAVVDTLSQIADDIVKLENSEIKAEDESNMEVDEKFESEKMESKESEVEDPKQDVQIDESETKTEETDDVMDSEVAKIMEEVLDEVEGYEESQALEEYVPELDQIATEIEVETNGYGEETNGYGEEANGYGEENMEEEEETSMMETEAIGPVENEEPKPVEEQEESRELSRWHMVCCTLEDWQNLAEFFKESEVKCEKALYRTIFEDFLPEIPNIVAEREKELARRESENVPRRQSCRLEVKRIEQEEMEKIKATQEAEEEKLKLQEEERRMERIRQARIEEQKRAREERERVREERANRMKKREERARMLAEGIEIPEELRNLESPPPEPEYKVKNLIVDNEVTVTMYKILDSVKNHPDSWLFWEPVEESFAPGYFEVVKKPIDIMRIEGKVNEREYRTTDSFINDLHLMFDNCILYNGTDSDYAYIAETLRAHLKKVYKKLMPKEDPQEDPKDHIFEPIVREPKTKPVKKKKPYVEGLHAMYEKEVMNDMRKVPPTKSSGTFKHGNYMVHMMPIRKVSKDTVFQEVDKEIEAYKAANQLDRKYTKLPALALYPPTKPDTPVFDSNDPLANRFKRKVDPANVCKPSKPDPKTPVTKPVEIGSPKVETLVSAENPAIKKNVWHISQEDMVKYRKIAQENGGFVEIKGPEGKTLKLQFKTVPKPGPPTTYGPAASSTPQTPATGTPGTPAVPAATTPTAVTPQTNLKREDEASSVQEQAEVPARKADVPSEAVTPKSETPQTKDIKADPETKLLERASEAALDIYKKAQQATPLRKPKDPNKKKVKDSPKSVKSKDQTAKTETTEEGSELDQSNASEQPMETSDVDENIPVDQSNESTEKPSAGLQLEDYESFKKGVEATVKQKTKSDPTKKKIKKPKIPEEKLSLDTLEKKIREGETLGEMTKIKKKSDHEGKKKKDKTFNGVIIRGVHHANGLDSNEKSSKKKKSKPKVESVKGNDSDFDEDDDIPLKRLWHPVQQSPDKLKLKISRAEKENTSATPSTPSDSENNTPSKGILKKFGTFDTTPYTKIKHKLSVETSEIDSDEPSAKKRKRVSFSEKLSIRKLPPVGEPGMSEEHRVTTISYNVETDNSESAIETENETQETPSTSDNPNTSPDKSPPKPVLTTMQQKIKKLKSDSTPQKYVCDFDMDDDGLSPISKPIPRKPKTSPATAVPTRGPCSYLKTSSTSALRDKPHEFSVNAPKATRPKVLSETPPKSKPRIISVINKTAKTVTSVEIPSNVSHVESVTKETVTKINSEEDKSVKMKDSAVETEIDLERENEGEDMPEMDIDPEEQQRAESLIKDLVKEITVTGSIRKKEKSKSEKDSKEKKPKVKDKEKKPKSHVKGDNSNSKSENKSGLVSENSERGIISDNDTKDRAIENSDQDMQVQNDIVPEVMDVSEELEREETNTPPPNLDNDQEIETMDTDMPTLEPIKDSEMPELSQEYDDISDENEEMPTLEQSPDIRFSDNSKSDLVKNSQPSENSSEIKKPSSDTSPNEKNENPKQTSSEKKKYRDREHPFFSDPIMISLYSPKESNTTKMNLMDSFMQLGHNSEKKDNDSSSASTSKSSPSTIPSSQKTENGQSSSS